MERRDDPEDEDTTRQDALEALNAGRVAVGLVPVLAFPCGLRGDSTACPVAVALVDIAPALGVGSEAVCVDGEHAEFYAGVGPRLGTHTEEQVEALSRAWGEGWWAVGPDEAGVALPDALRAFVVAFDAGAYPDLVLT